ncbi:hypothetical protein [Mesorhizobium sp. KR2-14]|uniref:hypothetical protein n=1 Tax=Mesorhizobium sp. KR2-14 TaxID=3156610 RepID=UPI0032B3F3F7
MTRLKMLAGIAVAGLMVALPASPSFAQEQTSYQTAQRQQQGVPQVQISPDQLRQMIRQAPRETMTQRMEEQGGPEAPRGPRRPGAEMMGQRGGMMCERLRERAAEAREEGGWRKHRHGPPWMRGVGLKILFAVMDANGDGQVTLDEVNDCHARIFENRRRTATVCDNENSASRAATQLILPYNLSRGSHVRG